MLVGPRQLVLPAVAVMVATYDRGESVKLRGGPAVLLAAARGFTCIEVGT